MKKFLIASGVAVLAFASVAGAASTVFSTNLTVGSTGADVVALQSALISAGNDIPAISSGAAAKGYFGSQTKTAVKAYQTAKGIPSTGFVGPLTRAALNGATSTVAAATCPAGYTCTAIGGTTGGTISTTGVEGSYTVKLSANPSTNTSLKSTSNVPLIGFDIKATDSDIRIDRANLQISVVAGGDTTISPASFVQTLKIMDGSNVLKTVSASSIEKDSGIYHVQVTGLGFVVPVNKTKTLTVVADVNGISGGDTNKAVTISNYGTNSFRGVDGAGIDQYSNESANSISRTQTFTVSGAASLTASDDVNKVKSSNVKLDATDGAKNVTVGSFTLKSTTGDSKVTDIRLTSAGTAMADSIYLYDGSTLLGSYTGSTSVAFTDLTILVAKDQQKTFVIKADYPATTTTTSTSSISLAANGVSYDKPDGTTAITNNLAIASNDVQLVNSATPVFVLVGTPSTPSKSVNQTGSTTEMSASVNLKISAVGGTLTRSSIAVQGKWAASATDVGTEATVNLQITPSTDVNDGAEANVVVSSTITTVPQSGYYGFYITSLAATVGGNEVTQTSGLDDYHTPNAYFVK